jgi:hypothetical protein
MTKIKKYVDDIAEELEGAKNYIETALDYKVAGNNTRYTKYKEMSMQELNHAMNLHEFAAQDIEQLKSVYPDIPQDMMDKWQHSHKNFVEKAAWIKQMQAM